MRRFASLAAWFLAVLWLPAAQHCELEALGILAEEAAEQSDCCAPVSGCEQHACQVVENPGYQAGGCLKVLQPGSWVWFETGGLDRAALQLELRPAGAMEQAAEPRDWVPVWPFVRRSAACPRAPSC